MENLQNNKEKAMGDNQEIMGGNQEKSMAASENEQIEQNPENEQKEQPYWAGKNYSFYNNNKCEYFPCHKTEKPEEFNCLFCFCPLYALKDKCGGNFKYTEAGVKDCSQCKLPHVRSNYGYIMGKFSELVEITKI